MFLFAFIALVAYSISLTLIVPSSLRYRSGWRSLMLVSALLALAAHGVALQLRIFIRVDEQNFSLLNISSLISLLICTAMTITAFKGRSWSLLPIVYSFALINLALTTFIPDTYITHLESTPAVLAHIGLSLFAYSTLIIAALYALQLAWIDHQLKNRKHILNHDMPPLLLIEKKMFLVTRVGVVLLTLSLYTGLLYARKLGSQDDYLNKTFFSVTAWLLYTLLLWGCRYKGWRGTGAAWLNFGGALLLTLSYFGSRIMQQIMDDYF